MANQTTTTELLQRLQNDPNVAQELYKCIEGRLKAKTAQLIRHNPRLTGKVSPSDILQSVFIQLLETGVPSDLRTGTGFLAARVEQRVLHYARKFGRQKRDSRKEDRSDEARAGLMAQGFSASKIASDAEEAEMARAAIQEMSEVDRTIITLRLSGRPWTKIGPQLGMEPDTARKRFEAAMRRLRARLGVGI
jgi:RNA polymerase sigma factor (sigma-70 family)